MPQASDTTVEAHRFQVLGFREMGATSRLLRACELSKAAQELALSRLRQEHPDEDAHTLRRRLAALWIDRELLQDALGSLPAGA